MSIAAIAATELTLARRAAGRFEPAYAERWASQVGRGRRVLLT